MNVTLHGSTVVVHGAPPDLGPTLEARFLAQRYVGGYAIPPKMVETFLQYYRVVAKPDATVVKWLADRNSQASILRRIHPAMKSYRGGYQVQKVLRALRQQCYGYFAIAGGGKTFHGLECSRLIGPTLITVPPTIYASAYVGTKDEPGDLRRFYTGAYKDADGKSIKLRVVSVMADDRNALARKGALRSVADVYCVSPYILGALVDELLELPLAQIITDESDLYSNIKAAKTDALNRLIEHVRRRQILSANPAPTSPEELYTQINFVAPGLLGESKLDFCNQYGEKSRWGWSFRDEESRQAILEKCKPYIDMMTEDDVWPDRPPIRFHETHVTLSPEVRAQYDSMATNNRIRVDGGDEVEAESAMAQRTKLQQIAAGFVYRNGKPIRLGRNAKLDALYLLYVTKFKRPKGCEQFVLWVEFEDCYEMVETALRKWGITCGVKSRNDRASIEAMHAFAARKIAALISHPKSLSHGVRLHGCRNQVWFSPTQSARYWYQALRRTWRPPQKFECHNYILLADGTVDIDVWGRLQASNAWRIAQEDVWRKK